MAHALHTEALVACFTFLSRALPFAAVGAVALVALAPSRAEACSPPPAEGLEVDILSNAQAVHRDGAVLLRVTAYDADATDVDEELTVSVTLDEVDVPGTLEVLDVVGEPSIFEHSVVVVWRPDAELAPAENYDVSVNYEDGWKGGIVTTSGSFSVIDEAAPLLESVTALVSEEITTGGPPQSFGERICCEVDDTCGGYVACVTEQQRETLSIRGDYELEGADRQYILIRPFHGLDGVADNPGYRLFPGKVFSDGYQPSFSQAFGSYCVAFEAVDLLHGTSILSDVACVDAPADLVLAETPFDVDAWAQQCLEDPYWEETGEPWEGPDGGTDSDTDGGSDSDTDGDSDSDTDGGSDSDSDGGSDSDSDSDSDPTDGGPGSGSDTDGDASASGGGGGCSVGAGGLGSAWALLGLFGLGAFTRRRR